MKIIYPAEKEWDLEDFMRDENDFLVQSKGMDTLVSGGTNAPSVAGQKCTMLLMIESEDSV